MAIWSDEIKELERLYESFKGRFPELEKELGQLIHSDDPNVILLYSRRCLEVIITDLCAFELKRDRGSEPLKGIIDKLNKEKKIPSHIASSMYGLNELSTYGTHPKDFDPQQVKPVLVNLDIIIKWYLKYKVIEIKTQTEEKAQAGKEPVLEGTKEGRIIQQEKPLSLARYKLLSGVLITATLIIAAILIFQKIFKRDTLERLRSSGERITVAVMPFLNITGDTTWDVWRDGIQEILTTSLSNTQELKIRQTESINNLIRSNDLTSYASITPSVASSISQKLNTDVFVYGNFVKAGSIIRVNTQLIDSKTEEVFKAFKKEGLSSGENIIQIIDSLSAEIKNILIISNLKKSVSHDYQDYAFTNSPEAYKNFIYGKNAFLKGDIPTAVNLLSQAVATDSNFIGAFDLLAFAYGNQGKYDQAKKIVLKLYEKRDRIPMYMKAVVNHTYAYFFGTVNDDIKCLRQILEIDDQLPVFYFNLGYSYNRMFQWEKAIPELEKSLEIYEEWGLKNFSIENYTELGYCYHKTGQFRKEKRLYKMAEMDFPQHPDLIYRETVLALSESKAKDANEYIDKYISSRKEQSWSESRIASSLADIYSESGILDKTEEYYRKALSLEQENPEIMNTLAYFLIDKNRNFNEGMELIDKALALTPDEYNYLHTKGWGIFKLGKYKEAFEVLQKSWDLRRLQAIYDHTAYLHLEEAKKAVAEQKTN